MAFFYILFIPSPLSRQEQFQRWLINNEFLRQFFSQTSLVALGKLTSETMIINALILNGHNFPIFWLVFIFETL